MIIPRPSRFLFLLPLLLPRLADATGYEEPLRWIQQAEKPQVLEAPEFYFALEMKRLAAELHPALKAVPPPLGKDSEADYGRQTADAELADFDDALATNRIAPPDAAAARTAHLMMRADLGAATPAQDAKPADAPRPEEFASEFADYHRGAVEFQGGRPDEAKKEWIKLLARPAAERHYRTTWALYMLGKTALDAERWDEAREWLQKTRQAAHDGFADTPGLAAAALGWEGDAELAGKHPSAAAHLYLEQLATGDESGVDSLREVLDKVFAEEAALGEAVRDPVLQRLGTAGAVAGIGPFFLEDTGKEALATKWLHALEKIDAKQVRDADRIAWGFYSRGEYAKAERWLARADAGAPYALWLRAKFALRAGKVDAAVPLLAQAVEKIAPESSDAGSKSSPAPPNVALGDLGALRLSRGEFIAALRLFLDAQIENDALYLADGVLTVEELKAFIERELPEPPKAAEGEGERDGTATDWRHDGGTRAEFRRILACRLVRAERYADARPFLDAEAQGQLDEYVALLASAKRPKASKAEQSEALWKAAELMNEHGEELANYYDPVTLAQRVSGRVVETGPNPVIALKYGKPDKFFPPLSKAEQTRLKKHTAPALHRYYSTYVAADLAWRAAALLPDNDDATASMLNTAGSWLKNGDDKAADRFYQAIERRCPKTELGKMAIKRHWFVPDDELPPEKEN